MTGNARCQFCWHNGKSTNQPLQFAALGDFISENDHIYDNDADINVRNKLCRILVPQWNQRRGSLNSSCCNSRCYTQVLSFKQIIHHLLEEQSVLACTDLTILEEGSSSFSNIRPSTSSVITTSLAFQSKPFHIPSMILAWEHVIPA